MTSVERPERECSFATLYKDAFVSCFLDVVGCCWMFLFGFFQFFPHIKSIIHSHHRDPSNPWDPTGTPLGPLGRPKETRLKRSAAS